MAVDYLSALNVGSGLNVTQIVDAIVDAERVPQESVIQKRIDEKTVSVSALGQMKGDMSTLDKNLQAIEGKTGLVTTSSDSAISIEETGTYSVEPFEHKLNISQIAEKHTLSFAGFTAATSKASVASLRFDFGEWNNARNAFTANSGRASKTVNITTGQNSIAEIASAVNTAGIGVEASVIKLSDGAYSLSFTGPSGLDNQMRVTATGLSNAVSDIVSTTVEGFEITVPAPTPGASGTDLERYVNEHSGGTYSISGNSKFSIDSSTGRIKSTAMIDFASGSSQTMTRVYTKGSDVKSEVITLAITEDTSKTVIRQARSELDIHNLDGLSIPAFSGFQINASRGALSNELAKFVRETRAITGSDGSFSLSGANAGNFTLNTSTGGMSYTAGGQITSDQNLILTFTAANGDKFVETIVVDHDTSHVSVHESTLSATNGGGQVVYNLGNNANFSARLQTVFNAASNPQFALVGAPTGVTVNHVEETYSSSSVNIGSAPAQNDIYELVVGSTTLRTASAGVGGYTSLNDVVTALKNDGDYAGAPFTISDSNGASAGGEIRITYKSGGPLTDQVINFRKVQETERYRSNTSLNIGTNNQQNDAFTLNVEGTVLTTAAAGVGGYTTLADVITALQADSDYAAAPFTISLDGSRIRVNYKTPGDQGNINISFSKSAGVATNFNHGGFDGSILTPSRNGYGVQTGFNNGGFNNSQKTPVAGLEGRYALEFDFSHSSLNAGQNVNFDINFSDGGALKHTEKVSFTVGSGANSVSRQADNGPISLSVAQSGFAVTSNTATSPDYANTATKANESISLNYDPSIRGADARHFARAGKNALFTFNGVSIIREENEIEDLVAGVKLTLNNTTSSDVKIGSSYDSVQALSDLKVFVTELNSIIKKLSDLTFRGTPGEDNTGPLADDNLAKSYLRTMKSMTTKPIVGYGDTDLFLSNFGVMTERDGSLTVNETKFNQFFTANPDAFSSIMNSRAIAGSNLVKPELAGTAWEPGKFSLNVDPDNTADIRKILPTPETATTELSFANGKYLSTAAGARGLSLTLLGGGQDTDIYLGKSLLDMIRDFADPIISSTSAITSRIGNYNDEVKDYRIDLQELNERIAKSRERYTKQFSDMNSAVTGFKKTEELLTNFQEAWKASLK